MRYSKDKHNEEQRMDAKNDNRTEQEIRARIARLDIRINKLQSRLNFEKRTGLHRVVNALKATKTEEIENIERLAKARNTKEKNERVNRYG